MKALDVTDVEPKEINQDNFGLSYDNCNINHQKLRNEEQRLMAWFGILGSRSSYADQHTRGMGKLPPWR